MKSSAKLYSLPQPNFRLPFVVDANGRLTTFPGVGIPLMKWPNGSWCGPANSFMRELAERGLSRREKGGTLSTYAANISHLIRFCYERKLDFIDITDELYAEFIRNLTKETRVDLDRPRNNNTVRNIGRTCLDFLDACGRLYGIEEFVGPAGSIRAVRRRVVAPYAASGAGQRRYIQSWHHWALPLPSPRRSRMPIGVSVIERLRAAAAQGPQASTYLRKRRLVMIRLLEITGGRRSEVAAITCDSVRHARAMEYPALRLMTAKRRGGEESFRFVPIARLDLAFIEEFISKNRAPLVRKKIRKSADSGAVLLSETSGQPLKPNTITQEVSLLARLAGVQSKACPHMFRHRFITLMFVALIENHQLTNRDEFRRALLDVESMKQKLLEWTGHRSTASLEPYVHLAFEDIGKFDATKDFLRVRQEIDALRVGLQQLRVEAAVTKDPANLLEQLEGLVGGFEANIS